MTSTITIVHTDGIVLAADRLIKYPMKPDRSVWHHEKGEKIYLVRKASVGISFWGLGTYERKKGIAFLKEFDEEHLGAKDSIDEIASKLRKRLEAIAPKIERRCGFHIAGYPESNKKPQLKHVFHEYWHDAGEFIIENSHEEYHDTDGNTVTYRVKKDCPVLFNGDNFIANVLFNIAKAIRPDIRIIPERLSLDECVELTSFVISTSINRLDYYFDLRKYKKIDPNVGEGGSILVIKDSGTKWYDIKPTPVSEILVEKTA